MTRAYLLFQKQPVKSNLWLHLYNMLYLFIYLFIFKDFFFFFFWMWTISKLSTKFCYNIAYALALLAARHVGSQLPDQGWNPHPLHWKAKSQPLDRQGSP